uniref:Uncharacterized protein n=1 Tax=Ixodes ricinus TaxID=34613 RepID=A0A6B0USJ8_IXORI
MVLHHKPLALPAPLAVLVQVATHRGAKVVGRYLLEYASNRLLLLDQALAPFLIRVRPLLRLTGVKRNEAVVADTDGFGSLELQGHLVGRACGAHHLSARPAVVAPVGEAEPTGAKLAHSHPLVGNPQGCHLAQLRA